MNTPAVKFWKRDGSKFVRVYRSLKQMRVAVKAWHDHGGKCKIVCR